MTKKIIYYCFGGTHSSVLAAAVHLNLLKTDRIPDNNKILNCPYFDQVGKKSSGKIFFIGRDEIGNEVFIMGCKSAGKIVETALKDFSRIIGLKDDEVIMIDTRPSLNFSMKFGGFLSRRLNLLTIGRFFLFLGTRKAFKTIVEQVKKAEVNSF